MLSASQFSGLVSSHLINVTVDDQIGDPITGSIPEYSPKNGSWHLGSPSEDCPPACNIGPSMMDLTLIYNKTWLDATYWSPINPATPTVTVRFTGSAVYVFNILPNTVPRTHTSTNISFSIDGEDVGRFARSPDSSTTFLYNQLVYHNTILDHGPHTLVMTPADGTLILFDYLIYTTQTNDTTPASTSNNTSQSSSSVVPTLTLTTTTDYSSQTSSPRTPTPIGSIVGAALGGLSLLGVAAGVFLLYQKHRRSKGTGASLHTSSSERGDREGDHWHTSSFVPPPISVMPTALSRPISLPYSLPGSASDASTYPSLAIADAGGAAEPLLTAEPSSKRRAEITQRLEALQRTRSALSFHTASNHHDTTRSEVSSEGRTEEAIRELEAEIAQLRGALTALNARLASGHYGHLEPLPEYVE